MAHRPVCKKCQVELKPEKNGIGVLEMVLHSPDCIIEADLYKCPECGIEIVVGFALEGIHHYEPDFDTFVHHHRSNGTLIICNLD